MVSILGPKDERNRAVVLDVLRRHCAKNKNDSVSKVERIADFVRGTEKRACMGFLFILPSLSLDA